VSGRRLFGVGTKSFLGIKLMKLSVKPSIGSDPAIIVLSTPLRTGMKMGLAFLISE